MKKGTKGLSGKPRIKLLRQLTSRVYFCREAALVGLANGLGKIQSREMEFRDSYQLELDEASLVYFHAEQCPTCSGRVYAGNGSGPMSMEACRAVADRINQGFGDLADGLEAMVPLMGLLESGTYIVADMDLFPVQREYNDKYTYFWDGPKYKEEIQDGHCQWKSDMDVYDSPLFLYPTQNLETMDLERIEYYRQRLRNGETGLRTIALYLNGAVALVLDGHHKAAAAAAEGVPARCLVIFQLDDEPRVKDALKTQDRLYLRHGKAVNCRGSMLLEDGKGHVLSHVRGVPAMKQKGACHSGEREAPWGKRPEACPVNVQGFPYNRVLVTGTQVPPDRLQQTYFNLRDILIFARQEEKFHYQADLEALRYYDRLFPEAKGLSPEQRRWICQDAEEIITRLGW